MQMKMRPFGSTPTFTQGDGGGALRFVVPDETSTLLMKTACFLGPARKGQSRHHNRPDHHING